MDESDIEPLIRRDSHSYKDRFHLVYFIVFFTGIGTLLPWNFFITVKQYFIFKLSANETIPANAKDETQLQILFENYITLFSMLPLAFTNIANLYLRRIITPMRRFSVGVTIMILIFILTLVLTKIPVKDFQIGFFVITMASVAILNICSGLIQGSAMGIISMLPERYIKGCMEGQAISGLIAAMANILTLLIPNQRLDDSALIYFIIALLFLLVTGFGFCQLGKLKYSRRYVAQSSLLENEYEVNDGAINQPPSMGSVTSSQISFNYNRRSFSAIYVPLIKRIYWYGLTSLFSFLVTLSLFPAIISLIGSVSDQPSAWRDIFFVPVTCFLFFNMADYLGRFLTGYVQIPSANRPVLLFCLSISRLVLIPLFFLCNVKPKSRIPTIFHTDIVPIALTWILGLTNGYFVTLPLIYAPSVVEDRDKEAVGTLMSLFLCIGLACGVALSLCYVLLI